VTTSPDAHLPSCLGLHGARELEERNFEERKALPARRPRPKARSLRAALAAALALAALGLAAVTASPAGAATVPKAPAATLGIWTSAEDSGSYSTVAGQHPDIANYYLAWGQQWPAQFISQAEAAGATPYIEIEPWHAGPGWNQTPSFQDIAANADSGDTDCTLDGSSYDTSCATWLAHIGQDVRQLAKPVIFTYGHEFNVSGQYPWAAGDTGSCGPAPCTPVQWIAAWDAVQAQIDGNGASAYASWMWAPNADTGGSTVNFTPWWPGTSHVSMIGLDGYPQSGPGWGLCTFQELFGQSFTEMKSLTSLPVFISETDLAPLSTSQDCNGGSYQTITTFMADLFSAGGDGILQFQDGTTALTSAQWTELDAALAKAPQPTASPASSPTPAPTPATPPARAAVDQPGARTSPNPCWLMHSGTAENLPPAWNARTAGSPALHEISGWPYPEKEGAVTLTWVIAGAAGGLLAGPAIRAAVFATSTAAGQPLRRQCPDCSAQVLPGRWRWRPVLPVTGRCPACRARIGPPLLMAELAAGGALAVVAVRAVSGWELAALAWLTLLAVPLALIDVAVHRLPDRLTGSAFAGTLVLLAVAALAAHQPDRLARAAIGGAALACFYLALCLLRPGQMGLGDVKLAASIGLVLGWTSWQALLTGTFAGFALAAVYSGVQMARHQATRTSLLPLGPFILLGTLTALALLHAASGRSAQAENVANSGSMNAISTPHAWSTAETNPMSLRPWPGHELAARIPSFIPPVLSCIVQVQEIAV